MLFLLSLFSIIHLIFNIYSSISMGRVGCGVCVGLLGGWMLLVVCFVCMLCFVYAMFYGYGACH